MTERIDEPYADCTPAQRVLLMLLDVQERHTVASARKWPAQERKEMLALLDKCRDIVRQGI